MLKKIFFFNVNTSLVKTKVLNNFITIGVYLIGITIIFIEKLV